MNNIKITNLPENTSPSLSGITVIVDNETTSKVTLSNIKDLIQSESSVFTTTYTNLQSLITSSELVPGTLYKITGFNRNMPDGGSENPNGLLPVVLYDDGTNSGTTIYLRAITTNTLSESGHGEFYNPRYKSGDTYNSTDGTGLYGIWDGDNPVSANTPDYQVNQVVFWGGYAWENLTGGVGSSLNVLELSSGDWEKLPYSNSTYYEKVIDEIKVDLNNGILIGRTNIENQITVEFNADQYEDEGLYSDIKINPIAVMGWGLYSKRTPEGITTEFYGILNVKVINSLCETINFKGTEFFNVEMNYSRISSNYFGKNCSFSRNKLTDSDIYNNTLTDNSYIYRNTLTNLDEIYDNTLVNGNIRNNTFTDNSDIYNNILINSGVNGNTLVNNGNITNNSLTGSNISENTLTNSSNINSNTLTNSSYIYNNILINSSVNGNTFTDNSDIYNNTLTNTSNINSNTLTNSSYIYNNILINSSDIYDNILTNSSEIYNNRLSYNSYVNSNTLTNTLTNTSEIYNNRLSDNSYVSTNTLNGSNITNNSLTVSNIYENTLTNTSNINNNRLSDNSYVNTNTLNGSNINTDTLTNGSIINSNGFTGSNINNTTLIISNITNNSLTSQTLDKLTIKNTQFTFDLSVANDIFLNTEKTIFTRLDGTRRLMYYNTGDTPTIVDVDA